MNLAILRASLSAVCRCTLLVAICVLVYAPRQALFAQETPCARIVSLAPSITEVVFDLGLGDRLVGVTRFCRFPPVADAIEKVGGMFDLNIEQIASKRPTDLFTLSERADVGAPLARLGISTTVVDHRGIAGILESYRSIGRRCGVEARALARVAELQTQEQGLRDVCAHAHRDQRAPMRVLVVVGRSKQGGISTDMYISGRDGFYSDILRIVGAENVHTDRTVAVPTVSAEGVLHLNPDAILEVVNIDDGDIAQAQQLFWGRFARISAVVNNRVFVLNDDFASIPGPRYILLAKKLSSLLCDS